METKKPNWFVRILIIALSIFIGILIYCNFFWNLPKANITSGLLVLISFLIILVLSEAFDNFSLGQLLSLSKNAKEKEVQNKELKKENSDLRNQIVNISTSISQKQVNSTFVLTDELAKMLTVKQAEAPEKEQKDLQQEQEITEPATTTVPSGPVRNFISFSKIEEMAFPKFLQKERLDHFPVLRDAKFTQFQTIDPISEYSPIFDGYINTIDTEIFIEMIQKRRILGSSTREHIYIMLSKIYYYRNIKRVNAYLFLVIVTRPDNDTLTSINMLQALNQEFEPAISNGLLKISFVEINQQELDLLN